MPPKKCWVDNHKSGKVTITAGDYEKANYRNLGDSKNLYLTVDTLQLACWFERLRAVYLDSYSLDCAHNLSAPRLAGNAFLKMF